MNVSHFFGLMAGIAALVAYAFYLKQAIQGYSTPNPSTWAIWLLVGLINAFTYFTVTRGSLWESFITIAVTASVLIVFGYSLFKGKFSKISNVEIIIFILAVSIGIFWRITSNDRIANLLLQIIYIISYIPTFAGLLKLRAKEYPASWIAALAAYALSIASLVFDPQADWVAYVHPVINGLLGNGLVVLLIFYMRNKKSKSIQYGHNK